MQSVKHASTLRHYLKQFRLAGPWALLLGPCLLTSVLAETSSGGSRKTISAGAAGNDRNANQFYLFQWTSRYSRFDYKGALESRHVPTTNGVLANDNASNIAVRSNKPEREPKHARISLNVRSEYLRLMLGTRYVPGPRTRFLAHPIFYSAFADLGNPRKEQSLFIRPGHKAMGKLSKDVPLPGLFALEDNASPGIFMADDAKTLFAAWHFATRRGVVALNKRWNMGSYRTRFRGDIITDEQTTRGDLDFIALPAEDAFLAPRISGEMERREYWDDFRLDAHGENTVSRRGKSGLGSVQVEWRPWLSLDAAGQDKGVLGMRLAGLTAGLGNDSRGRLLMRGRAYRLVHYGEALPRYEDTGGALGYALGTERLGFRILYEERRIGAAMGELSFWFRGPGIEFSLDALFGPPRDDFIFMRTRPDIGAGSRFYPARAGALVLRVKSESFYFYLSSTATKARPEHYGNLQFKLVL